MRCGSGQWGQAQGAIGDAANEMGSNLPLIPGACGTGSGGGTPTYGEMHIGEEHGCLAVEAQSSTRLDTGDWTLTP